MREDILIAGLNSDQSYLINEICHLARHDLDAAGRLGFKSQNSAFYAANALKRLRRNDRNSPLKYPPFSECLRFDAGFMTEFVSLTERDLPSSWEGDESTYALGNLLSRLAAVSKTSLGSMIDVPQAELSAIRARCIHWGAPMISRAVKVIGGTWDILSSDPKLQSLLHELAEQDKELEFKIRLLTHAKATQQNISTILGITRKELQIFTEYYTVDVYAPPGRTKFLSVKDRNKVYYSLLDIIDLAKRSSTNLSPVDQFLGLCQATGIEGRCIVQGLPEMMVDEANPDVQKTLRDFMVSLNIAC